jgi:hypothetical protein
MENALRGKDTYQHNRTVRAWRYQAGRELRFGCVSGAKPCSRWRNITLRFARYTSAIQQWQKEHPLHARLNMAGWRSLPASSLF